MIRVFSPPHPQVSKALDALLVGLSDVAKKASEELGPKATEQQIGPDNPTVPCCSGAWLSWAS